MACSPLLRSIPTCVGLGPRFPFFRARRSVHPHVRGARASRTFSASRTRGPSPRAWGSGGVLGRVGEERGPSPRAWGSGSTGTDPSRADRSIPTCVGLGPNSLVTATSSPVHPHVRGARARRDCCCSMKSGPSPRAWGSGSCSPGTAHKARSIPTCVGLGLPDLRKLSPLPICNQNYRSDTRTCNDTVTLCGCPYGHGYSPTLIPAYAQHWLAALTTNLPRTQSDVRNTVTRYSSTIIHPD